MNTREEGTRYERLACEYLKNKGYRILEQNFRCRSGEIDIIAKDGDYIVFLEVKYRRTPAKGSSLYAVGLKKQQTISRCALYYLSNRNLVNRPVRFDVVGIDGPEEAFTVTHIENAFSYTR